MWWFHCATQFVNLYGACVDLIQTDAFGSFVHVDSEIEDTIVTIEIANASKRKKS